MYTCLDTIQRFLLNGRKGSFSVYRIFVDSDNEDDETKFVDDDDDVDEGWPSNQQAANDDDDEEDELDKFMAGIEVRQSNFNYYNFVRNKFWNGPVSVGDVRVL